MTRRSYSRFKGGMRRTDIDRRPSSLFRKDSNTMTPVTAEMTAINHFVPLEISFRANLMIFSNPLVTVICPIKRIE